MRKVNATLRLMGAAAALMLGGGALQASTSGPDAAGYTATDAVTYSFIDISGTGTGTLAGADDDSAQVSLGFPFQFYGHTVSSVCLSSNGLLSFGACGGVDFANQDLTAVQTPNNLPAIAAMWTDLTFAAPGSGAVQYQTLGEAGSRRFIAQWTNAYVVRSRTPVTFQAILEEGTNQVRLQYRSIGGAGAPTAAQGGAATIGIRDTNGEASGRRVQWSYNSPVLTDSTALLFTQGSAAVTVVVTVDTSPTGLSVTVDGASHTAPKTFSWTSGTDHTLAVNSPQTSTGTTNTFSAWSNGGAQSQTITVPSSPITYTATFSTQYLLTTRAGPTGAGTVSGGGYYPAGDTASVGATANPGYRFSTFSGDLTGSTNPGTLVMNGPKTVVANFIALTPSVRATVGARSGTPEARVWNISLINSGPGLAANAQISSIRVTQTYGTSCAPAVSVTTAMPVSYGDLAPSTGSAMRPVTFDFHGCPTGAKFSVTVNFRANGGAYTGSTTLNNQVR